MNGFKSSITQILNVMSLIARFLTLNAYYLVLFPIPPSPFLLTIYYKCPWVVTFRAKFGRMRSDPEKENEKALAASRIV
jgi:hypothetical protein